MGAGNKFTQEKHKAIYSLASNICILFTSFFLINISGVIYLKNLIYQSWASRDDEPSKFTVHEQDRVMIRDTILDVIVQVPELLR